MSKDIRSFFISKGSSKGNTSKPTSKVQSKTVIHHVSSDDDSEEIFHNKKTVKEKPTNNKKRKIVVSSDSESEITVKIPKNDKKKPQKSKKDDVKLKPVDPLKIFGSAPVKQIPQKKQLTEMEIHMDDDFAQTLSQLDEEELLKSEKKKVRHKNSPSKIQKTEKEMIKPKDSPEKVKKIEKEIIKPISSPTKIQTIEKEIIKTKPMSESTASKTSDSYASSEDHTTPKQKRKRKKSDSLNDSTIDPDEERYEKRRQSAALYQQYLHRSGPKNRGSKEIPKGKPDCFKGLVFIVTGVLDSLEREEAQSIISDYGGKISSGVTGKVNYMVMGEDAGPAKIEKAKKFGTKILSEDEFLDLIRIKSGLEPKLNSSPEKVPEKINDVDRAVKKEVVKNVTYKKSNTSEISDEEVSSFFSNARTKSNGTEIKKPKESTTKIEHVIKIDSVKKETIEKEKRIKKEIPIENRAWVDKYKPQSLKQIIGQLGDKSNAKKLLSWLENWHKNRHADVKKPSIWAKSDDGAYFKAALLSGPPGVGKTTTATLVCKELGYDTVELNASDTRNKRSLHDEVSQLLSNKSLFGYFTDNGAPVTNRHVLLMDEVDGMGGNEDRGGMQELIELIRKSSVPIICMCNDRSNPKMRSLSNYCFDLRFAKPRIEQIRGAMMSICFKEGIKVETTKLDQIIISTGNDVRQTLNNLSLWSAGSKTIGDTKERSLKKDTKLGPWEVIRKVFSAEDHKTMTIHDKCDLFFNDYNIIPLFVQENYLGAVPNVKKNDILSRVAAAADSISFGDLIEARVRRAGAWNLLPLQAVHSTAAVGAAMSGHLAAQINFPSWLGKNSKFTKHQRLLSELQVHMRLSISGSRQAVNLDYGPYIRDAIVKPLVDENIDQAVEVMHAYHLLREDLDNVIEISNWSNRKDPMTAVNTKVKSAFTRTYNKEYATLPYSIDSGPIKKRVATTLETNEYGDEDEAIVSNSEDEDDITHDAMIKAKKATKTTKTAASSKNKASTSVTTKKTSSKTKSKKK